MPLRSTVPLAPVAFVACFAFVAPDARADDASKTESRDPPAQPALLDTPDDEPVLVVTPKVRDEEISIAFRGALQVRGLLPFGATASQHARADGDLAEETAFELRRVRLGLDAMILPTATVHVSADLVDSLTPAWTKTPLFLAYANLDTRIIQVRAGLVRVPFTRHGLVDETRQVFLEPAAAWRSDRVGLGRGAAPSVLPDRRVGVELHEETDGYALSLGAFSGGGVIGTESGSSAIFAGRLELAPWGAVPLEGAYFRGDAAYTLPRVTFALGGLARAGLDGGGRAISMAIAASYYGLYASIEAVLGDARPSSLAVDVVQRALVADLAYRFALPALAQGLELGVRADALEIDPRVDAASELRALSAVASLYFFRHRVKASTLARIARTGPRDASTAESGARERDRQEGILELTVGF